MSKHIFIENKEKGWQNRILSNFFVIILVMSTKYQPQEFEKKWVLQWKKDKTNVFNPNSDKKKNSSKGLDDEKYRDDDGTVSANGNDG